MSPTPPPIPSLADRVRPIAAGGTIVGVHFLGKTPVFVLGEEALLFAARGDEQPRRHPCRRHPGERLRRQAHPHRRRRRHAGRDRRRPARHRVLATDDKRRWIDQVALGPDGAVAWSAGKTAHVLTKKGEARRFEAPSTVAGLAFAPKGFRLAIAHYNGATLWFPNAAGAKPETLTWKGSHLSVAFSPDGKFLVTAMQEPMLHGWRLADAQHMRMSGYSARVRSLSWSAGGEFLATSGSEQLILWPFDGKDGPMGRQPKLLARSQARVAVVACHPRQPVVAVGYADGMVLLVRIDDGALILAKAEGDVSGQRARLGCQRPDAGLRYRGGRGRCADVVIDR